MDAVTWLLDDDPAGGADPAIRWQTMRDLADAPPGEIAAERARVATEGWGARLLALQEPDGSWGGRAYDGRGDRRATTWTLHLLRRFGIDPDQAPVRAAVERVRAGVRWAEDVGGRPFFDGEDEPCINGGVLALSAYFGQLGGGEDGAGRLGDGAERMIGLLLDEQLEDGGWNCDAPESQRSSFDTTLCVIEGLLAVERATASVHPEITEARRRGEDYLLERNLFRRRTTGEIALPRYANFAFPPYWTYDVLRALDYFRETGDAPDPRIGPALELLLKARGADGTWPAGEPWHGEVFFAVDAPAGHPSRWNTLRALRVLRWAR